MFCLVSQFCPSRFSHNLSSTRRRSTPRVASSLVYFPQRVTDRWESAQRDRRFARPGNTAAGIRENIRWRGHGGLLRTQFGGCAMFRIAAALLLCATFATQTSAQPPASSPVEEKLRSLLEGNPELLSLNQAFQTFLRSQGDFGAVEKTYMDMAVLPSFRDAAASFEESLSEDPPAWKRFLRYNAFLGSNPKAREEVDTLLRLEMNRPGLRRELGPALAYLRGHPDDAVLFSRNPALLAQIPDDLHALRNRFRTDPGLQQGIHDSFKTLAEMPEARSEIFPWWETAYADESDLKSATRGLDEYLLQNPAFLWNLRSRNAQWASQPDAFAWTQYLHGAVRREPKLAQPFYEALGVMRGNSSELPGTGQDPPTRAIGLSANLPSWPPPEQPPKLTPKLTAQGPPTSGSIRRPTRPTLRGRPTRPQGSQGSRPTPPKRPTRPTQQKSPTPPQP